MEYLVIGGVILLIMFASSKASAGGRTGSGADPLPDPGIENPVKGTVPVIVTPTPKPGASPSLAIESSKIWPGFDGYVRISDGDNLIKIAKLASKLDGAPIAWRSIRDDAENQWCKAQTPATHWEIYGLELVHRYGHSVGIDCEVTPGWRARLFPVGTATYPVIRVRQPA